jgi:hypothetical protein
MKNTSRVFVILLSLLVSCASFAKEQTHTPSKSCIKHPLYCRILAWRPKIDKNWAMKFSNLLHYYGKKHDMDPWRSLSIAMQESSLRKIHRKEKVIIFLDNCSKQACKKTYRVVNGFTDLSLFQFHIDTILNHGMDPLKLNEDMAYVIQQHYILLKKKQAQCKHLKEEAWSCYHSKTPSHRKRYVKLVNRYFNDDKK